MGGFLLGLFQFQGEFGDYPAQERACRPFVAQRLLEFRQFLFHRGIVVCELLRRGRGGVLGFHAGFGLVDKVAVFVDYAGRATSVTDWTSLNYVVDVEGNGHQPPDLVELAVVPITGGKIGQPASWLVQPEQRITPFARTVHGITNAAVASAPVFADIRDEVLAGLTGNALVAHNAHVDIDVLERKLRDWQPPEVFDTLKLARRLLPEAGSYKLGALVETFKLAERLPSGLRPHRATYDVLVTARLFVRLALPPETRPLSLEELRGEPPRGGHDAPSALF